MATDGGEEASYATRQKEFPSLAAPELVEAQAAKPGVVWIDVREQEEWRRKNLPGALLLPCSRHDTVALRAADANGALPRKRDTPLLVFCGEVREEDITIARALWRGDARFFSCHIQVKRDTAKASAHEGILAGGRSALAVEALKVLGFTDVVNGGGVEDVSR